MTGFNTGITGNIGGPANFQNDLFRALGGRNSGSGGAETKAFTAIVAASPYLSHGEQHSLLTMARELSRDGDIDSGDAALLTNMADAYSADGEPALESYWPFSNLDFSRAPGNKFFAAMTGFLGGRLGESMRDLAFLSSAKSMLENSGGNSRWMSALASTLAKTDLSKLSGGERTQLLTSIAVATSDNHMSWSEAAGVLHQLSRFSGEPYHAPEPKPQAWTSTPTGEGQAQIDLGDYTIEIDEHSSAFTLTNKLTGEKSNISGDPHFDTDGDGKTDVDFWGTMTLNLEDGTRITVNTTPYSANNAMTLSSQLVITKGEQSMVVNGLDQNQIGDLTITQSNSGKMLDALYGNGLNVYENPEGKGWQVQDGIWMRDLTQADADQTKAQPGNEFRPGLMASLFGFAGMIASSMMMTGMFEASGEHRR